MVTKTAIIFGLVCSIINGDHVMIPNLSFYQVIKEVCQWKDHRGAGFQWMRKQWLYISSCNREQLSAGSKLRKTCIK